MISFYVEQWNVDLMVQISSQKTWNVWLRGGRSDSTVESIMQLVKTGNLHDPKRYALQGFGVLVNKIIGHPPYQQLQNKRSNKNEWKRSWFYSLSLNQEETNSSHTHQTQKLLSMSQWIVKRYMVEPKVHQRSFLAERVLQSSNLFFPIQILSCILCKKEKRTSSDSLIVFSSVLNNWKNGTNFLSYEVPLRTIVLLVICHCTGVFLGPIQWTWVWIFEWGEEVSLDRGWSGVSWTIQELVDSGTPAIPWFSVGDE